jgi:hypothetical protein
MINLMDFLIVLDQALFEGRMPSSNPLSRLAGVKAMALGCLKTLAVTTVFISKQQVIKVEGITHSG